MAVISRMEELNKHGMLCQNCDSQIAYIFITMCRGGGGSGYSYCKKCALDTALEILKDYKQINDRKRIQG